MPLTLFFIALFAVLGAWARYGQSMLVQHWMGNLFPWATLSVNVLGSFVLSLLFFLTLERIAIGPELRTGILTGGLGAFTTFSTFSLETLTLIENGDYLRAVLYILASVILSLIAAFLGLYLARHFGG